MNELRRKKLRLECMKLELEIEKLPLECAKLELEIQQLQKNLSNSWSIQLHAKTYCGLCNGIVSGETYTIDKARHYAITDMSYVQKKILAHQICRTIINIALFPHIFRPLVPRRDVTLGHDSNFQLAN